VLAAAVATTALLLVSAAAPGATQPAANVAPQGASAAQLGDGFTHGTVRVSGNTVLHYVKGGSGPPVVLLHGWPQTWWIWHKVMPGLAEHHTVVAFDLPGLGDSTASRSGFEKATTAAQIHQATQRLGLGKVDLVGHDLGGLIAYPYATQFPDDVNRVVVLDTPLTGFGLEDFFGISWHFLFNMSPAPIPELILDDEDVPVYLGMLFRGAVDPSTIDQQVYFDAYADPAVRTAGYEYYRAFPADAAFNQANAGVPVDAPLLAMGSEFTFGPFVAASFEQVASDVRPVIAPGSAHFIPEERPDFVLDCLVLFLGPATGVPSRPELAGCAP
jgi:pimeloyl-ACP methyl ester carboxylesterase